MNEERPQKHGNLAYTFATLTFLVGGKVRVNDGRGGIGANRGKPFLMRRMILMRVETYKFNK